jgi:hypothetical protein
VLPEHGALHNKKDFADKIKDLEMRIILDYLVSLKAEDISQ